jgi:hypothetical protein
MIAADGPYVPLASRVKLGPPWRKTLIAPLRNDQRIDRLVDCATTAVRTKVSGTVARLVSVTILYPRRSDAPDRCPADDSCRPARGQVAVPAVATAGIATTAAQQLDAVLGTAATAGQERPSEVSVVGVRPVRPPWHLCATGAILAADTAGQSAVASGMPSGFRTRADALPRPVSPGGCVARGTARRLVGRWSGAASADGREPAARSGGRGAARGRRSSPGA